MMPKAAGCFTCVLCPLQGRKGKKRPSPAHPVCSWQQASTLTAHPKSFPATLSPALPAAGWLYQQADSLAPEEITFTPVSEVQPTEQQLADLRFAWRCVKHVKSNAITVAKDGCLLGMGSGQPNRVKSVQIALEKADAHVQVRVGRGREGRADLLHQRSHWPRHCWRQVLSMTLEHGA